MANSALTISFSTSLSDAAGDKFIDIDLDDELNNDRTSFLFGETVYFRIFTNCTHVEEYPSEGTVMDHGTKTAVDITDQLIFSQPPAAAGGIAAENTAALNFPANSGTFSAVKLGSGAGCGSVTLDPGNNQVAIASSAGPGVYTAKYNADYLSRSIVGPALPAGWDSEESYPVVIVVVGT